jgi:hypothetical protein
MFGYEVTVINKCMKHIHHIIPRHAGGTDDPSNLIELTVEEHALAHKKLYEEHGDEKDLMAYQMLTGQIGKDEALFMARSIGGKTTMSDEVKLNYKKAAIEREKKMREDGRLAERNKKISEAHKGKKKSKEHLENWSKARTGYKHSPETIAKIKAARANQKNVRGITKS